MSVIRGRAVGTPRIAALVVLGLAMLAVQLTLRGEVRPYHQVTGQLVAGAIFLIALWLVWGQHGLGWIAVAAIVVAGVGFRAAAFVPADRTPPLSTDVHRYAWDGRVQLAGISPYRYAPIENELRTLRDDTVWPGINRKTWHTIYPPAAQASFVASQATFGDTLRSTTWLYLAIELVAIGLIVLTLRRMRAPPVRVLALAWHPLAISEVAGNGHVDALAVAAVSGLLAAWAYGRTGLAGLAAGVATLAKLGPLLLVPAVARRGGKRFVVASIGLVVLAYVPYAATVGGKVIGSLEIYDRLERFNGSMDRLLRPLVGAEWAQRMLLVALLVLVGVVALRRHDTVTQVARSCLLVLGGLLVVVDYVQPWHALVLIPCLALVPAPGWLWLTLALPIAYVAAVQGSLPVWAGLVIWAPLGLFALARLLHRRRATAPVPPPANGARTAAIIPVLNEQVALAELLADWPAGVVDEIVVVDGGSTDRSVEVARAGGARVVEERRRGYGRACATGAAATDAEVLVFLDGDGSCDPVDIPAVLAPVRIGTAALCLGRRAHVEPGAMTAVQRVGNRVVATVLRLGYGVRVGDVPCLRAVRADALAQLGMREMTYGWPTEMIVRAARTGMAIAVVPVSFRQRRGGTSKVSGRLIPSARAGARMMAVALREV